MFRLCHNTKGHLDLWMHRWRQDGHSKFSSIQFENWTMLSNQPHFIKAGWPMEMILVNATWASWIGAKLHNKDQYSDIVTFEWAHQQEERMLSMPHALHPDLESWTTVFHSQTRSLHSFGDYLGLQYWTHCTNLCSLEYIPERGGTKAYDGCFRGKLPSDTKNTIGWDNPMPIGSAWASSFLYYPILGGE